MLFNRLGLAPARKGKTGYSTDAKVLATLRDEHEIVPLVEEWRELTKLLNTYLEALPQRLDPRTGRLHTTFNQTVATTGRLSSSNPNLQNIPIRTELGSRIRSCFVAEEGWRLIVADYSQIELRLMAYFAGEPALLEAFRRGEDVHRATAAAVAGIAARGGHQAAARSRQGDQLRHHVRPLGLRPLRADRHEQGGGARVHRRLLRALSAGAALPRRD